MIKIKSNSNVDWLIEDENQIYFLHIVSNKYFNVIVGSRSPRNLNGTWLVKPFLEKNELFFYPSALYKEPIRYENPFSYEVSNAFKRIIKLSLGVFG